MAWDSIGHRGLHAGLDHRPSEKQKQREGVREAAERTQPTTTSGKGLRMCSQSSIGAPRKPNQPRPHLFSARPRAQTLLNNNHF